MRREPAHRQLTSRRSAEQRLAVQYAVAQILADTPSLPNATAKFLEALCSNLGCDWGCLWKIDHDAGTLRYVQSWHPSTLDATELEYASRQLTFTRNVGLPGRVWAIGKPVYIADVSEGPTFLRLAIAVRLGLRAALGIPILVGCTVAGVMEFFSKDSARPGDDLLAFLGAIGSQIGQFSERVRLEEERTGLLAREQEARAAAQANEDGLYAALDQMPEGVVLFDTRGRVRFRNQVAVALSVGETGQVDQFGNPIVYDFRLPSGEPLPTADIPSARTIKSGETLQGIELLLGQRDGRLVSTRGNFAPVFGPRRERLGTVAVFQDITAIKDLERQREEWISVVTHDLRQPVTIVLGYAERLAHLLPREGAVDQRKSVDFVLAAARNLNRMIGDLLDASRIETRRLTLECECVDLSSLVRAIVERATPITSGHNVQLKIDREIPRIVLDPTRIEQVLDNLLSNTVKYGDPGTDIQVQVERRDADIAISVTNRGRGIAPEDLPKIFTRFYRTREAQVGKMPGLGLGLYIAKGIVETHGGRIWAESTPNQTTIITFSLPVRTRAP